MRSARTAKHIIIGLLLLGILLVGGWYFLYPYSLGSRISASEPLSLSVNITGVTVTGKDTVDTVTYEFQPDTQEYKAFLEMAVTWLTNFFEGNMGKAGRRYVPYLSTVLIYLGIANMIGMFGFGMKPPTKDINVTVALALMSIILIEASTFRAQGGIKGFLKSFTKPMALLTPLNVMEIAIRPLSLCMRLFGNVLGAFVVMQLIEHVCGLIIPMVFSMYFDVFDGLIQAYVFVFLTSLFMAEGMEVEEESVPKLQQA